MGAVEFLSSIVGSLAWPVSAVVLGLIFRRPLVKMLNSRPVKTFEAGPSGFKVEYFDEKIKEARTELAEAHDERVERNLPTEIPAPARQTDFMDEMKMLAEVSPSAAVLESFARLERALREAIESAYGEPLHGVSARRLAKAAVEGGMLAPSEFEAFADVAQLRNVVTHRRDDNLDIARALSYVAVVDQLMVSLSLATGTPTLGDTRS